MITVLMWIVIGVLIWFTTGLVAATLVGHFMKKKGETIGEEFYATCLVLTLCGPIALIGLIGFVLYIGYTFLKSKV